MRYDCCWQHQSPPERIMGTEDTPYGSLFSSWQNWPMGQRTALASTAESNHAVQSGQAEYKDKELLNFAKTG